VSLAGLNGGAKLISWQALIAKGNGLSATWSWSFTIPETIPFGTYRFVVAAQQLDGTILDLVSISFEVVSDSFTSNVPLIHSTCAQQDCPKTINSAYSTDISSCKIKDLTATNGMSEGFPRPAGALINQSRYKVLVVPVSFSDLPFTTTELSFTKQRFEVTNQEFQRFSLGASAVEATFADPKEWLSIGSTIKEFITANRNDETQLTKTLLSKATAIQLQGYDVIWITSARSKDISFGAEQPFVTYATSIASISHVFSVLGGDGKSIDHGLGHMLFYFDDEYQFPGWVDNWSDRGQPLVGFDIYGRGNELIGWNRFLAGWIPDQEILCLPSPGDNTAYRISYLNSAESGTKLLLIPTGPNSVVAAEYQDNQDSTGSGLLVYKVDLTIPQWQIRFRGDNRILGVGDSTLIGNFKFSVVAADATGIYIKLNLI